ncbi:putative G-protein coupled receptor 112 [Lonchura striata]|uniref:G-protein coupled receptor 112 n=1 Tax=Lonchura striata TaxID=40157 RepID=A0A218UE23_9PASE|nr:putative G-protein coupled receptor 112 [Lonchura striata domestica]
MRTAENAQDVVEHILYLLPDATLHAEELEIIASKISDIVALADLSVTLAESVLSILDYILLQEIEDESFRKITNSILKMTEEMGYKVTYTERNMSVITTSLALLVLRQDPSLFRGLAFDIASYNRSVDLKISVQENPFRKVSVFLPKSLKNFLGIEYSDTDKRSKIQFKFFGTTSLLLDDSLTLERLNTYVVSASIENASIQNLNEPGTVTLHHIDQNRGNAAVHCVFWDFGKNKSPVALNKVIASFGKEMGDLYLYKLLDICNVAKISNNKENSYNNLMGKVGRDNPSKILLNLCAAPLLLNIVFLANSWLTSFNQTGLCITVAMLLHYFLLAAFTWMCLESVHFYLALVKVFNVYVPKYMLKCCIAGWGLVSIFGILVLIPMRRVDLACINCSPKDFP